MVTRIRPYICTGDLSPGHHRLVTVTVTVNQPPQQRHENPLQNPTKRVLQLYQAVRYVNVLKPRATVQQDGERRGSWLGQPPSAAPR